MVYLSDFRMVPVVVAVEAAVAHAVEALQDVVVANAHTEHNTLLLLKIFPAVASKFFHQFQGSLSRFWSVNP